MAERGFNLLLPSGLSTEATRALAENLVAALAADPRTASGMAERRIIVTDEGATPREGVPSLNTIIGTLSVPVGPGVDRDAVQAAIRGVPGAEGVRVEPVQSYGILPGEE